MSNQIYPRRDRVRLVTLILITTLALDHLTKWAAIVWLKDTAPIIFWGDLFRLQYATNTGAFLSLFGTLSASARFWLLVAFNAAVLSGVGWYIYSRNTITRGNAIALALILAGGVGNLIDRVFRDGVVVDFMNVGINFGQSGIRSGIFNIADLGIVGGLLMLVSLEIFAPKDKAKTAE